MTTVESNPTPISTRPILVGFYAVAVLLNLGLITQVLTVGLAYFYDSAWWTAHVWLVRGYGGLSLVLLALAYWIPVPTKRGLAASLPILLGLQFLTIHLKLPLPIAVLHPLIGFTLFSISTSLVHASYRLAYPANTNSKP